MKANNVKEKKAGQRYNGFPARKAITGKVKFIAQTRGIKIDDAWRQFVGPAVQAEFDRCVAEGK